MITIQANITTEDLAQEVVDNTTQDERFELIKQIELGTADVSFLHRLIVHFAGEAQTEAEFEILSPEVQRYLQKNQ